MAVVFAPGHGVDLTPNARAPIAQWALDVQRVGEFEPGGRGPILFDCMGVVTWAQPHIGRQARDYLDLYRDLDIKRTGAVDYLMRQEAEAWRNVDAGDVGDVLVLGSGDRAHHVAVLCGAGHALHALERVGMLITKIEGREDVRRFAGLKVFGCVAPSA